MDSWHDWKLCTYLLVSSATDECCGQTNDRNFGEEIHGVDVNKRRIKDDVGNLIA